MLKKVNLILSIFFAILIYFNQEALAFHKKNMLPQGKPVDWNPEEETTRNARDRVKSEYCGYKAREESLIEEIEDIIENPDTGEKELTTIMIDSEKIRVHGYHDSKARKIKSPLRPNLAKLFFEIDGGTKFIEVLKMYCLQDLERRRPSKFKGSYLETLYEKIAKDNGLISEKKNEGDYNLPIGDKIFAEGILIKDKNIVYYLPDFLIEAEKQNIKDKEAAIVEAKRAAEIKRRAEASKKWVKKNKPKLLKKAKEKQLKYDNKIKEIKEDISQLNTTFKQYAIKFDYALDGVEETFNITGNKANRDIKEKLKELRQKKKLHLNKAQKDIFNNGLNNINKRQRTIKDLTNYQNITKLIENINSETKSKNKIKGYEDDFDLLKSEKLETEKIELDIAKLNDEITKEKKNIDSVISLKEKIDTLDNELSEKGIFDDVIKIAIYVIIFLIILGLIVYLILQSGKMNKMNLVSKSNESKFGKLEDQIRDNAEKMQREQYIRSRQEKTTLSSVPPQPKEPPKTPEEITFGKYEEMMNNYKEALDNFSKVAAFKQKWKGLALTRKERQDGTKTVLINSSRAFEKSEIWCTNFDDSYFALPGSTVKSNMATYMNLDFEKAQRDFKGVFSISTGPSYFTEVALLRRGGAGFVVDRIGKLQFPQ
jgi:hypothetical protein